MIQVNKKKIYLTGFGKFGGVADNPSTHLINNIESYILNNYNEKSIHFDIIGKDIIEVSGVGVKDTLSKIETSIKSDNEKVVLLHLGVSSEQIDFHLEKYGWNLADFRIPDERGWKPLNEKIISTDNLEKRETKLPVELLAKVLGGKDYIVTPSDDPDKYKELADRMQKYENRSSKGLYLKKNQPFIIRLDGHGFSKFTKPFKQPSNKPWDLSIHKAMIDVSKELFKKFHPSLIYTFSDEITLCFPSVEESSCGGGENDQQAQQQYDILYSGRIQKLLSLSSGMASTTFYKSLISSILENPADTTKIKKHIEDSTPFFDARICMFPSNHGIIENIIWRSRDCIRNSVSGLSQQHFDHNEIFGLPKPELIRKLKEEKNINIDDEPDWYRLGCYLKKQIHTFESFNKNEKKNVITTRNKIQVHSDIDIYLLHDPLYFLTCKSLPENYNLKRVIDRL
eukprot:gene5145-6405_t